MDDRSAVIALGGEQFELLLTTGATKGISKRYGGIDNLGSKLMQAENFDMALDEIVWLVTLLANQPIMIHNLRNPNSKRELLTEEYVDLLTCPADFADCREAITIALQKGMQRNVISEEEPQKNAQGE